MVAPAALFLDRFEAYANSWEKANVQGMDTGYYTAAVAEVAANLAAAEACLFMTPTIPSLAFVGSTKIVAFMKSLLPNDCQEGNALLSKVESALK